MVHACCTCAESSMAQFQFQPDGRPGAGMKRQATWDALPDIDLFSSASERNPILP